MLDDVAMFAGALTQAQIQTVMSGDFSSFIGGACGHCQPASKFGARAGVNGHI